jgi:hypothetical protein
MPTRGALGLILKEGGPGAALKKASTWPELDTGQGGAHRIKGGFPLSQKKEKCGGITILEVSSL